MLPQCHKEIRGASRHFQIFSESCDLGPIIRLAAQRSHDRVAVLNGRSHKCLHLLVCDTRTRISVQTFKWCAVAEAESDDKLRESFLEEEISTEAVKIGSRSQAATLQTGRFGLPEDR